MMQFCLSYKNFFVLVFLFLQQSCRTTNEEKSSAKTSASASSELIVDDNDVNFFVFSSGFYWTKFVMTISDTAPYFMNANFENLHYPFAKREISQFHDLTQEDFESKTLHTQRLGISGNVYLSKDIVGVSFVSLDKLATKEAIGYLKSITSHIKSKNDSTLKFSYVPDSESYQDALQNRADFQEAGFDVTDLSFFSTGSNINLYASGWTIGRLVQFKNVEVENALKSGALKPSDILFTDKIGANQPILAGVITEGAINPGAHPVLLAQSIGTPLGQVTSEAETLKIKSLLGKEVFLSFFKNAGKFDTMTLRSMDQISPLVINEVKNRLMDMTLNISIKESYKSISGKIYKPCLKINSSDRKFFGGKSTNFRILCDSIPDNSPKEAIAISFDAWDQFLQTKTSYGSSLKRIIDIKLSSLKYPPQDLAAWQTTLQDIRTLIVSTPFPENLKKELAFSLNEAGFSDSKTIRFRSSTNVEDGEDFNGAGLYDSFSGCLGDETPTQEYSKCASNHEKKKLKPFTSAMKKVFASFYNDKAVFARKRFKINENSVGMAVLVHNSFPDETELANGVITTTPNNEPSSSLNKLQFVSHPNAVDVTDPSTAAKSEVAEMIALRSSKDEPVFPRPLMISRYSELLPLGQLVLKTEETYKQLSLLVLKVQKKFEEFHALKRKPKLDMEYKLTQENNQEKLIIKQVREIPTNSGQRDSKRYLVGSKVPLRVAQIGGFAQYWERLIANHLMKAEGYINVNSGLFSEVSSSKSLITGGELKFLHPATVNSLSFSNLKDISSSYNEDLNKYDFRYSTSKISSNNSKEHKFNFEIMGSGTLMYSPFPIVFGSYPSADVISSGELFVKVKSKSNNEDLLGTAKDLEFYLYAYNELSLDPKVRNFETNDSGINVKISYQLHRGTFLHTEFGLGKWNNVEIGGLTKSPFKINAEAARTYAGTHHNQSGFFLIEPGLDPEVSPETKAELRQKNIRMLVLEISGAISSIGFDNKVKMLNAGTSSLNIPLPKGE